MAECTGLENRRTGNRTGGSNPSRSVSALHFYLLGVRKIKWKRGRAVIQRIANPSVPYGLGRFNSCRFR